MTSEFVINTDVPDCRYQKLERPGEIKHPMSSPTQLLPLRYRDQFRDYQRRAINMVRHYKSQFRTTANPNGSTVGAAG
jgi:hypothetical protein